jgi:hypothetical protein
VDKASAKENDEKPILVPLTSSLYVPGKMADIDTYMVDVGTGYFVEKVSYILPRTLSIDKMSDFRTLKELKSFSQTR